MDGDYLRQMLSNAAATKRQENELRDLNASFNSYLVQIVGELITEIDQLQKRIKVLEENQKDI